MVVNSNGGDVQWPVAMTFNHRNCSMAMVIKVFLQHGCSWSVAGTCCQAVCA